MKKLTPILVNLMLTAVTILAVTISVKMIEDLQYERLERAKTEYEYRYKETTSVSVENSGEWNEKRRYNLWIYDRETGKIKYTGAWVYNHEVNGATKGVDTKVMQGMPSND